MSEKYISASLFKEAVIPSINKTFQNEETMRLTLVGIIEKSLDVFPAADVEPVVRCRDCIDYEKRDDLKEDPDDDEKGTCKCHCIDTWADHYCGSARHKKHFAHMERSGSGE